MFNCRNRKVAAQREGIEQDSLAPPSSPDRQSTEDEIARWKAWYQLSCSRAREASCRSATRRPYPVEI